MTTATDDAARCSELKSMPLRFAWANVNRDVLRQLLAAAYVDADQGEDLHRASAERLAQLANTVFGTRPSASRLDRYPETWEELRRWALTGASREQRANLVDIVALGQHLSVAGRERLRRSDERLTAFVKERNLTENFKVNLRKAFIQAHKSLQPSRQGKAGHGSTERPSGATVLHGQKEKATRRPYPHQVEARASLDRLIRDREPEERRGLIVLPTGAGKTETVTGWLTKQMTAEPRLRVLWLAHQQELLEQAARSLLVAGRIETPDFTRRMRIISSAGAAASVLVEEELDVALVTWQTLDSGWEQKRSKLRRFLTRGPAIVVVDEAHHAAAPGYQRILGAIAGWPDLALIGLTATPWPGRDGATLRLIKTFPVEIIRRSVEQMHADGILAVPILHTVDSGQILTLSDSEKKSAARTDLPPNVLSRLRTPARDQLLVRVWKERRAEWGKSLVFATGKAHADHLGSELAGAGADVRVLHSSTPEHPAKILDWFRKHRGDAVLVSVGMLTEGVDLPDAETAFLVRPTTSRVLLRQMIGRVLRGPEAGGAEFANVVHLRDQWSNFDEVLSPAELVGLGATKADNPKPGGPQYRLPPVLDEGTEVPIAEDVLEQIRRMYSKRATALPLDPASSSTRLIGYYALDDINVPVMEHQQDGYERLIRRALSGKGFQGTPALSFFDDDHPPYPTQRALDWVLDYVRTMKLSPPLQPVTASVSPVRVARKLRDEPAMSDPDREQWLLKVYERTLARLAYETFEHFEEAVERELRELRRALRAASPRLNAERIDERTEKKTTRAKAKQPKLNQISRSLPTAATMAELIRRHLATERIATVIRGEDLPEFRWTENPNKATWAHWSMKTSGKGAGNRVICVNSALRVRSTAIPEEMIKYLLYHEILHDWLPGQGHDAEFRRLEALWPDSDELDLAFDTLHERYILPERVR